MFFISLLSGLRLIKVTARALWQFFANSSEQFFSANVLVSTHEFTSVGGTWHTQHPAAADAAGAMRLC